MKKAKTILLISAFLLTFMITKSINVMQDTEEIWKEVSGYGSKYAVSNMGRMKNQKTGRILKPQYERGGYVRMTLSKGAKGSFDKMFLHRLVLICFNVPNPENKSDVNHINGNPSDNRLENLEWATRLENVRHALITGLSAAGKGNVVLDAKKVLEIRAKHIYKKRGSIAALSEEYGVAIKTIKKVIYNERWRYV